MLEANVLPVVLFLSQPCVCVSEVFNIASTAGPSVFNAARGGDDRVSHIKVWRESGTVICIHMLNI